MDELTRKALEFYADPENWKSPSTGFGAQYDPEESPIQKDWGQIARRALSSSKKGFSRRHGGTEKLP